MSVSDTVASAVGHGAGFVGRSIANGTIASGTVGVVTGGDTSEDVLVSVSFDTDEILSDTFTVAQTTGTGLGATLSHTVQNLGNGFTITATAVPTADAFYLFTWTE